MQTWHDYEATTEHSAVHKHTTTTYGYNSAHELVESIRAEVKDGEVVVTPETITAYTYSPYGQVSSTGDV